MKVSVYSMKIQLKLAPFLSRLFTFAVLRSFNDEKTFQEANFLLDSISLNSAVNFRTALRFPLSIV